MTLSVIIPVFNVAAYLDQCLQSVVGQRVNEMEILLVNDGSTDHSGKICEEYAAKDNRFRYFVQKNQGLSAARNRGLDEARGEYLFFLDSDDWLEADVLPRLLEKARMEKADMVVFQAKQCRENGEYAENWTNQFVTNRSHITAAEKSRLLVPCLAWLKIYHRDFIDTHHIRFIPELIYEDNPWNLETLYYSNKVVGWEKYIIVYRIRKDSISNNRGDSFHVLDQINLAVSKEIDFIKDVRGFVWLPFLVPYWIRLSLMHFQRIKSRGKQKFHYNFRKNLSSIPFRGWNGPMQKMEIILFRLLPYSILRLSLKLYELYRKSE